MAGNENSRSLVPPREPVSPGPAVEADSAGRVPDAQPVSTDRARTAHEALRAMARAARAYQIYDPANAAVQRFFGDVTGAFERFTSQYGDLELSVRPTELLLQQDVIYQEKNREQSLAAKLFRDGVRKVTVRQGVSGTEIARLLEILAVRSVGSRQQEDDIVTLLWQSGLKNIVLETVEAYVADDDDEREAADESNATVDGAYDAQGTIVPADFDLPAPDMRRMQPLSWLALDDATRAALVAEDDPSQLPRRAVELFRDLLSGADEAADPLHFEILVPFVREVRDYLVTEGNVDALRALYEDMVQFLALHPNVQGSADALLAGFLDQSLVERLLTALPTDAPAPVESLGQMLDLLPDDPFPLLLQLLETSADETLRRALRQLVERSLPARVNDVVARLAEARGAFAADLLRLVANCAPDVTEQLLNSFMSTGDVDLQREFLLFTRRLPPGPQVRSYLAALLRSTDEAVRVGVVEAIQARGERGAFPMLLRYTEARLGASASDAEIEAAGRALAGVDPVRTLETLHEWCQPRGVLRKTLRLSEGQYRLVLVALEHLAAPEAEALLRVLAVRADEAVRPQALALLARRRRGAPPPGSP